MKLTGNQLVATAANLDHYFAGLDLGNEDCPEDGFHVSNDTHYFDIRAVLKERAKRAEAGIGIFVGSGGMLSLMPDLKLAYPIMVDKNPAITNFNQTLAELVAISDSPEEVIDKLAAVEAYWDQFGPSIGHYHPDVEIRYYAEINDEARVYGQDHWTDPTRFPAVKAALAATPPTYVNADITNRNFADALHRVSTETGLSIGFANLTNVHRWLEADMHNLAFANEWPMEDDALIMYSSFFRYPAFLEMALATKQSYLDIVRNYHADEDLASAFGKIALDSSVATRAPLKR